MLLDVLDEARMRTLAPDVRMLWLDITRMMQRDGISVLRFGNEIVKPIGLSRLVFRPETESETELETKITELCDRGLLSREADGAIACPMLQASMSRSEINKINGSKGGRPRKDGLPAGQGRLLLPIDGGVVVKTKNTEMETAGRQHGSGSNTTTKTEPITLTETEYHELGKSVLDAIGIDPARSFMNYGQVKQWLADGADPKTILRVINEIMERPDKPEIRSLRYFDNAIQRAAASRERETPQWEKEWTRANAIWELTRSGPRPSVPEYKERFAA